MLGPGVGCHYLSFEVTVRTPGGVNPVSENACYGYLERVWVGELKDRRYGLVHNAPGRTSESK